MKKVKRRFLSLILALAVASLGATISASAESESTQDKLNKTADFIVNIVKEPYIGSTGGEWAVLGLARSGYNVPENYYADYYNMIKDFLKEENGILHDKKYTEYSRVVLALTSIGKDPMDVGGYNLLLPLADFEKTVWQGLNGPIWALIAFDSGNYDIPLNSEANVQGTRELYIEKILSSQLDNGGWNLTDEGGLGEADIDVTGMALQALSKYVDMPEVDDSIDKAITFLSESQNSDGGYSINGERNVETIIQVIVALCELGIPIDDERFIKEEGNLYSALISFQGNGGQFEYGDGSGGSNEMATEQGLYCFTAIQRAENGENTLYDMSDVTKSSSEESSSSDTSGMHEDVSLVEKVGEVPRFNDITKTPYEEAVMNLAMRGIVSGIGEGIFNPEGNITRAEFSAIVVRALGLPENGAESFTDVDEDDWFATSVGTANYYGIVKGDLEMAFNPHGKVTRQEATLMLSRAADLWGLDTTMETFNVRNTLAAFIDYVDVSDWAMEAMAFSYERGVLDDSELEILPKKEATRGEIALMLNNLMEEVGLYE